MPFWSVPAHIFETSGWNTITFGAQHFRGKGLLLSEPALKFCITSLCAQLPSPVQSHNSQTAARLRLQSWSALSALGLHWDCTGTALGLHWDCTGTALGLHWDCTGTALGLHWDCTGTALGLHWDCTGPALGLHWDCTGTALGLVT